MDLALIRERAPGEARVALTPEGVRGLVEAGHEVTVEAESGLAAGFPDSDYRASGAHIAFSAFEAARAAQVMVKVRAPAQDELELITPHSTLVAFLHLTHQSPALLQRLTRSGSTAVALELIEIGGRRAVMDPVSGMGGRIAISLVQHHLSRAGGGTGVLIGGSPGVPPVRVCVVGGGVAGVAAAEAARAQGAEVTVLDVDPSRLVYLHERLQGVVTAGASAWNLGRYMEWADVVVGAVARRGLPAPKVLTTALVRSMRPGTLLVDLSIDEGGCAQTSRPTTVEQPIYVAEGVRHLCIPNLPSLVARTASEALSIATMPLLAALSQGMPQATRTQPELLGATQVYQGTLCCSRVARIQGGESTPLGELLG